MSPIVERTDSRNSAVLNFKRWNYYQPHTGVFVPESLQEQVENNTIETSYLYNQYDTKGNLLEGQKPQNVKECYFLGYNGRCVVAKVLNADYNTAKNYVNQAVLDNPSSDQALRDELQNLRNNLPDAQVTSFTYKPLIGLSSHTDMLGNTTYYEYDGYGRVVLIRDKDQNIVKRYCYNFSDNPVECLLAPGTVYSNQEMGQLFYYEGVCGRPLIGGPVYYYVMPGKYTSTISQEDADLQAQNDINTNGPVYAASFGAAACYSSSCNVNTCDRAMEGKKCVNGECQIGYKVIGFCKWSAEMGAYYRRHYYIWSDGSVSPIYETYSATPCQ